MSFLKRSLPRHTQVGRYYVKAKERRGPSLRTWLSVSGGFIVAGAGLVVYLGEYAVGRLIVLLNDSIVDLLGHMN